MRSSIYRPHRAREQEHKVRCWLGEEAPPLLMLHGLQDSSATFQFVVDAFEQEWNVFAPDFRGHGLGPQTDALWLHDMVADTVCLLEQLFPGHPVPLVGHSMGANVASIIASLRPDLVTRLVLLDALGPFPHLTEVSATELFSDFLERIRSRDKRRKPSYHSIEVMAERLCLHNPALRPDRALWLAREQARELPDGRLEWRHDPRVGRTLAGIRGLSEWQEMWAQIRCPVLWVTSGDNDPMNTASDPTEIDRRKSVIADTRVIRVEGTSHNLHHDQPDKIANLIEDFLAAPASAALRDRFARTLKEAQGQ